MVKRDIIKINEDRCTGCGSCASGCPEGAIQVIDEKARLVSDLMCDGLGACIGTCPEGAITIEKREAELYNERKVMINIVKAGTNTIKAHLKHLEDHKQNEYHRQAVEYLKELGITIPEAEGGERGCSHNAPDNVVNGVEIQGCPGSATRTISRKIMPVPASAGKVTVQSELQNWPIELRLINPAAEYFDNADILIAADCTAFSFGNFHQEFLKDKVLIIFCPKLDSDPEGYTEKLAQIFKDHAIKSITLVHMQVPCCFGQKTIVDAALKQASKRIPVKEYIISTQGEIMPQVARFFRM